MSDLDFIQALQGAMDVTLSEMNTVIPGVVESYVNGRAQVRSSFPKSLANGQELSAPLISNVPVIFPSSSFGGKKIRITFPVSAGDGVLLLFSQRSLEGWLSGDMQSPDDPRMFDISDAIAIPGLSHQEFVSSNHLEIMFGEAGIRIQEDGTLWIGNSSGGITVSPDGGIAASGPRFSTSSDIDANGINSRSHVHTGVQAGSARTQGAVPNG